MREFVKNVLKALGFKLIKLSSRRTLAVPNVDNVEIVVQFYHRMGKKITLLQIGACDGVTSDSIFNYIKSGSIKAYLVEPGSVNFGKLKSFYSGATTEVTLINAAIADKDETRAFYSIKDEGRWKDSGWARQLASFYKQHLIKHGITEQEINQEDVRCLTLKTILSNHGIEQLDILVIDTEGYDGEIVKMALNENILPNFIAFENVQLLKTYSQEDLNSLYKRLLDKGYVWTHDRINTLAVRKDFFSV